MHDKTKKEITDWLKSFAKMVRSEDYSGASKFFDVNTFGFGTIAKSYLSLDEYNSLQWQQCWSATRNFDFDYSTLHFKESEDNATIVAGIMWSSIGVQVNRSEFPREGRATLVFKRDMKTHTLLNIHSHYSRTPKNFPEDF